MCGEIVKEGSGPYRISVRAAILALGRFRIASSGLAKKLEKEWAKYRTQNQLDLYGCPAKGEQTWETNAIISVTPTPCRVERDPTPKSK
jgi:hypothetical protein